MKTSHERRGGCSEGGGGGEERRERGNLLLISAFPGSGAGAAGEPRSAARGHRHDAGEGRAGHPGGAGFGGCAHRSGPFFLRSEPRPTAPPMLPICLSSQPAPSPPPMAPPSLPTRRDPLSGAGGVPRSFSRGFLREGDAARPGVFGAGGGGGRRGRGDRRGVPGGRRGRGRKSAALRQSRGHRWLPLPTETICLLQMVWKVIKVRRTYENY